MEGVVEEIYITDRGSAPMVSVPEVKAVEGGGLEGDRYHLGTGYWTGYDQCPVTMIAAEDIEEIASTTGLSVTNGEHRRNLITRGISLLDLAGKRFRIGDALLEYDQPRPPCRYIQSITEPGMTKALGRNRGGICVRVVESGTIRPGDAISVTPPG
jgi:MOSC domain-containing protein YiiM